MARAPKKRPPKKTDKKQSERFRNAVEEEGLDVTSDEFERAFHKIVPPKKKPPAK